MDLTLELVLVPVTDVNRAGIVEDIEAARTALVDRGLEISGIRHFDGTGWAEGTGDSPYNSFADFGDPDGNTWVLQEGPS